MDESRSSEYERIRRKLDKKIRVEFLKLCVFVARFNTLILSFIFIAFNGQDVWRSSCFCLALILCESDKLEIARRCMSDSQLKRFIKIPFKTDAFLLFVCMFNFFNVLHVMWISVILIKIQLIILIAFYKNVQDDTLSHDVLDEVISLVLQQDFSRKSVFEIFWTLFICAVDLIPFGIMLFVKFFLFSGFFVGSIASILFPVLFCLLLTFSILCRLSMSKIEMLETNKRVIRREMFYQNRQEE